MKIGIDCRFWNQTGVGRYTRNLVSQLAMLDENNQYVLFVKAQEYEGIRYQLSGISYAKKNDWKFVKTDIHWHSVAEQIRFPKLLSHYDLDLIHFPYFSVPIFYRKPYVITIHDLILHNYPTGKASTLPLPVYNVKHFGYKFVIQQAATRAKKIIAISESTKKEIIDHLKIQKEKIVVIYEGIDEKVTSSKLTGRVIKNPYFLYVGNAYPHKNLPNLLEAFKKFIEMSPGKNAQLVLVGKEDYFYGRLKSRVSELNLQDNIIFLENVSDDTLANLYRKAKALVFPSLMEGFGLPLVEAMANNCLVIASNISAFREVCSGAAVYFNPNSVDSIASLLYFVNSHEKAYFSKNIESGHKQLQRFSWKKMAEKTKEIYESCAGVRPGK